MSITARLLSPRMTAASHKVAYLFPGQGSQKVGMGQALARAFPAARQVFQEADELLGIRLSEIAWGGPAETLNDTLNTQPALMVHSVAALRVLQDQRPEWRPAFVAGHSMGELSALVAAGALDFETGLRLVRRRGELMKQAGDQSPGGMAAVLGLDIPTLEQVCSQASAPGEVVQVANDNCPGQVVISGARSALERAMAFAQERGARRVIPLAISIAAHSPLMAQAQAAFNKAVDAAALEPPHVPVVGNVEARPLETAEAIRADLKAQLTNRVRWTESIEFLRDQGISQYLEIGSGTVLGGLLKRIDRQLDSLSFGEPDDLGGLGGQP